MDTESNEMRKNSWSLDKILKFISKEQTYFCKSGKQLMFLIKLHSDNSVSATILGNEEFNGHEIDLLGITTDKMFYNLINEQIFKKFGIEKLKL